MKYEVEALDTYEKNSIIDNELNEIPKTGKKFIVNEERLKVLLGDNEHKLQFVNVIGEATGEDTEKENPVEEEVIEEDTKKDKKNKK